MRVPDARPTILVVDDDVRLAGFVASQIRHAGYNALVATDGEQALARAAENLPDLVILDLAMPGMSGVEVLASLREWYTNTIIILSAIDQESSKVEALDLGADDYLTKPFGPRELLARVRSALRRAERAGAPQSTEEAVVVAGSVRVDLAKRTVTRAGREVALTRTEYELLRCLAANPGKVMTHRELLREVWGPEYGEETEYLRTFIKQLRRKLEENPSRPAHLLTQPGIGYRLVT